MSSITFFICIDLLQIISDYSCPRMQLILSCLCKDAYEKLIIRQICGGKMKDEILNQAKYAKIEVLHLINQNVFHIGHLIHLKELIICGTDIDKNSMIKLNGLERLALHHNGTIEDINHLKKITYFECYNSILNRYDEGFAGLTNVTEMKIEPLYPRLKFTTFEKLVKLNDVKICDDGIEKFKNDSRDNFRKMEEESVREITEEYERKSYVRENDFETHLQLSKYICMEI